MADSPCSVPDWLRLVVPLETPRQQAACRRHDDGYAAGGGRRERLVRDLLFPLDLMGADPVLLEAVARDLLERPPAEGAMEPDGAERYCWGVRMFGGLHWPGGDGPGAVPLPPAEINPEAP